MDWKEGYFEPIEDQLHEIREGVREKRSKFSVMIKRSRQEDF